MIKCHKNPSEQNIKKIVLATLNARYIHASIGLRYLYANLGELQNDAVIMEFVINENIDDLAEKILSEAPKIVGIGVYIWNALDASKLVKTIKKISPQTIVVLGGAEVSYEPIRVDFDAADYIIQGEGEEVFYRLCKELLQDIKPSERIIKAAKVELENIELPYVYYDTDDIKNRIIYFETSRGCPFLCEFCISSLDNEVRKFDTVKILDALGMLWDKGVRHFKFVDRTFNVNVEFAKKILDFFLEKDPVYMLHFEMIPDHFPTGLREKISLFEPATLQFEIGIQTLNKDVAKNISRKLNIQKIEENLSFLENETNVHMHLDLIIGLPGEDIRSFGCNLNQLMKIGRSEIQLGILKKLSGVAIKRHDTVYGMVYADEPPYEILQNDFIDFFEMQRMKRFARFWDMFYNSGNFKNSIHLIFEGDEVFEGFYRFSEWIYSKTLSTWKISLDRLAELLFLYLHQELDKESGEVALCIAEDIMKVAGRKLPKFLREHVEYDATSSKTVISKTNKRQILRL